MNYIEKVLAEVKIKNNHEPEFIQAVEEVLESLKPLIIAHPEYERMAILERVIEPERIITFKVPWTDDSGKVNVNRGYRVQFNSAIGPYKGGLRFHPSVNQSIIKFLGFEQTFKNSLTSLPIGGGKGGSDFDPKGKSDQEVMRFCQSFMTELYRHIGPNVDVPAGDIGVGAREIGYLFGQYKRIRNSFENGVLTGKGINYGGSQIRPEATGFGAMYYTKEMLDDLGDNINGKILTVSGYGNVAWGVCMKASAMGAKVVTISGRDGYIYDEAGINTEEKFAFLTEMRAGNSKLSDYATRFNATFYPNEKPWGVACDIAVPCATQNEISADDAKKLIKNGCKYVVEGANMPTSKFATTLLMENNVIIAPGKAANAGGVAVSSLEMSQNSMRLAWSREEVDARLEDIMKNIYHSSVDASKKYGLGYNLIAGANVAGFEKVVSAMIAMGEY